MKRVMILNHTRPLKELLQVVYCDTFLCRLRGLTFRRTLGFHDGLVLVEGRDSRLDSAIHMMGVFLDLSVIWINSSYQVVDTVLAQGGRPAYFSKAPARYILEIVPQRLAEFQPGDQLEFDFDVPGSALD